MSDVAQKELPTPDEDFDLLTIWFEKKILIKPEDMKICCNSDKHPKNKPDFMECISHIPQPIGEQIWRRYSCKICGHQRFIRFWV